jgi:hypothetical protein
VSMPYKINGPKEIDTRKLLLWPDNPRLKSSSFNEVKYTLQQLISPTGQAQIFIQLAQNEQHDVATLVKSMCKVGFMREKAPIVLHHPSIDRYLVLEGNRRLTAIKTIQSDSNLSISPTDRRTLDKIPCWLFAHIDKSVALITAIKRMVAEVHIKGQKAHTKLQQAHMLYDAYRSNCRQSTTTKAFKIDPEALRLTADILDFPLKALEAEISVVRIYKQLVETYGPDSISHKHTERLSWVHKNQAQFKKHFGYDSKTLSFDNLGLEGYYDIFLSNRAAVINPQSFRTFLNIMRADDVSGIDLIRQDPAMLTEISERISNKKEANRFLIGLQVAEKRLRSLTISDFRETKEEIKTIKAIESLVNQKLVRLADE